VEEIRIDKWLWAARFFKTRGAATDAVSGGKVLVNGVRVKPSKEVRPADRVEIQIGQLRWEVDVRRLADKRGPVKVAAALYEERPDSIAAREQRVRELRIAAPPGADLGARPTKRDRRRLEALRRGQTRRDEPR